MKRVIGYCVGCVLAALVIFEAVVMSILLLPGGTYDTSYQAIIQDKYDLLMSTDSPKIILVGGSSLAFGIDADSLSEATEYSVVNLGLHAGFGDLFVSELAKQNIGEGDIVLLGYEYNWAEESDFRTIGTDLVMSGIDDRVEMYRIIPMSQWPSILGYLFTYAAGKNSYVDATGLYSRAGFSADGNQMIAERDQSDQLADDVPITVQTELAAVSAEYMREFKEYAESRGASVYIIAAPYAEGTILNADELPTLFENTTTVTGIPCISNPTQYELPWNEMYDFKYHCNSKGEQHRTEMLIQDLRRAHIAEE